MTLCLNSSEYYNETWTSFNLHIHCLFIHFWVWSVKRKSEPGDILQLFQRNSSFDSEIHETVTGLHDQCGRECNPMTPVEYVSLSFCIYATCILPFITRILCINEIEMDLVWLIPYTFNHIFFKFASWFIALMILVRHDNYRDSTWWRCGWRCCSWRQPLRGPETNDAVAMLTSPNNIMTSRSLNTYYDVTQSQCMNGLWIFITKLKSPKGDSQINSSKWGVYDDNDHSHTP